VARVLVTGATGFIGSHLVPALLARGDDVRVTVRGGSRHDPGPDVEKVTADITDRAAMRRAARGVERAFHVAGSVNLRMPADALLHVNAEGTRTVLGACLAAGVERVVHVSSVAAIGPARPGGALDERHVRGGPLGIPYADAKHAAEVEALRVAAQGLDVVVANPAHVLGRGDERRSSTEVVRRFLLRRIPAYVDGGVCIVDVEDVVGGLLLCEEKGASGERYILGTRNYTWQRLFGELERVSGIEGPAVRLPVRVALALAEASARTPGPRMVGTAEIRAAAHWWTYRSAKARRELGWTTRPHEDTVEATVRFHEERLGDRLRRTSTRQPLPWRLVGRAVKVLP
jgi:dihydroflavonol-4-reductase